MSMHLPRRRMDCWTTVATERAAWSADRGAARGNAPSPEHVRILLAHTPTCSGCARLDRAIGISDGTIIPHTPDHRGPVASPIAVGSSLVRETGGSATDVANGKSSHSAGN